jgi:hypothetical protein
LLRDLRVFHVGVFTSLQEMHMERFKSGIVFWVLLIVSIALPVSAQKAIKKQLYQANISVGTIGKGSATMLLSQGAPEFMARTYAYPNSSVTRVSLVRDDGSWPGEVVLCENGGLAGDCTYSTDGNLDIEGAINGPMLGLAGITGAQFLNALQNDHMKIQLNGGGLGVGTFIRVF